MYLVQTHQEGIKWEKSIQEDQRLNLVPAVNPTLRRREVVWVMESLNSDCSAAAFELLAKHKSH